MQITIGKILGLLIALGFAVAMMLHAGGITAEVFKGCAGLLLPLALIWFPDEIGSATGYLAGHMMRVDVATPPVLISFMGWFFLIGLPVVLFFLA